MIKMIIEMNEDKIRSAKDLTIEQIYAALDRIFSKRGMDKIITERGIEYLGHERSTDFAYHPPLWNMSDNEPNSE